MGKQAKVPNVEAPLEFYSWLLTRYRGEGAFRPFVTVSREHAWWRWCRAARECGWITMHVAEKCSNNKRNKKRECYKIDTTSNKKGVWHCHFTELGKDELRFILVLRQLRQS